MTSKNHVNPPKRIKQPATKPLNTTINPEDLKILQDHVLMSITILKSLHNKLQLLTSKF